jgi:nitrite transporter
MFYSGKKAAEVSSMFREDFSAVTKAAETKVSFLKNNPVGYFVSSMLAGIFVGFGVILIFSISGLMTGVAYAKIVMGAVFGGALSLVVLVGAELFTGNNFVMTVGMLQGTVSVRDTLKLWLVCLIGNWAGAILISSLYFASGLASGPAGEAIATAAASKMSLPLLPLFLRGVLCNTLVCLAVWVSFRLKSESGKLILIFWCLFVFVTAGFEHSIANMSLLTIALLKPFSAAVSIGGYFYNILVVILGNMAGGIFLVALPYGLISKEKEN